MIDLAARVFRFCGEERVHQRKSCLEACLSNFGFTIQMIVR